MGDRGGVLFDYLTSVPNVIVYLAVWGIYVVGCLVGIWEILLQISTCISFFIQRLECAP